LSIYTATGLDLGGSGWRMVRVTSAGPAGQVQRGSWSNDVTLEDIRLVVKEAAEGLDDGRLVGISVPALVDAGAIQYVPALPALRGLNASEIANLTEPEPVRATLHSDVAAGIAAEARFGAGRDVDRFMLVMIGTGASAAMWSEGAPVVTVSGCLGDVGHMSVHPSAPPCWCGGVGCLEAICSGRALSDVAKRMNFASARQLIEAANQDHGAARQATIRAAQALGRAIAQWSVMLRPDLVAIGGGIGLGLMTYVDQIVDEARRIGPTHDVESFDVVTAHWPWSRSARYRCSNVDH